MDFDELRRYVPEIPDLLIDMCTKTSASMRDQIILKNRACILINHSKNQITPSNLIPPTDEISVHVLPQQIQFVSLLVDYLHQNPHVLVKALRTRYLKPNKSDFNFMCSSAIPSFFGFFSSSEHIAQAFPFYCSLVGVSSPDLVSTAILPFYNSACTFRYIETIYNRFGLKFCHDVRLASKSIQKTVLKEYIPLLMRSLRDCYKLIPHSHQFLIKYMKTRGWSIPSIYSFFLHKFIIPQLLRFFKFTPFKFHFDQFIALADLIDVESNDCAELSGIFDSHSIFEIPPAFSVFDIPYIKLLMTPSDVDSIVSALIAVQELPTSILPFINHNYFANIDYRPFWIRVYSRKPKPVDASYNWRRVVFGSMNVDIQPDSSMERLWLGLVSKAEDLCKDPVSLLCENPKNPVEKSYIDSLSSLLGDRMDAFINFGISKTMKELNRRTTVFERYLVHSLARQTLSTWLQVIDSTLEIVVVPFAEDKMILLLQQYQAEKYLKNYRIIDRLIEEGVSTIDLPVIRQRDTMIIVQSLLPLIINQSINHQIKAIDKKWIELIENMRLTLVLPNSFSNKSPNKKAAILLHQKLWAAIEHLSMIAYVKFCSMFQIIIEFLFFISEITTITNTEDGLIQYAIVFCDCPIFLSRFILINSLMVKQERFKVMSNSDTDLVLWCQLETSILKLLSQEPEILSDVLALQDSLIEGGYV